MQLHDHYYYLWQYRHKLDVIFSRGGGGGGGGTRMSRGVSGSSKNSRN